jgi:organic radical activating enzyme
MRVLLESLFQAGAARYAALACLGVRYLSWRKAANLLRCEAEKRRRSARVRAFPYAAVLDVTNRCNLRCPYCPTGARRNAGRTQRTLRLTLVDRLLEEIGDYLISVNLFNWGEPLLHPRISEIVSRFHSRKILTVISSNLSMENQPALEAVCRAGLDYLVVSTSGASQETTGRYHRNSRISTVAENVRFVSKFKRKNHRLTPVIEWKYLLFRHNAHELASARALAAQSGADIFRVVRGGGEPPALVDEHEAAPSTFPSRLCHQLWHMVVLNPDGCIAPCCYLFFKSDDFADLAHDAIPAARNNEFYRTARSLFSPSASIGLRPDLQHPCLKCEIVDRLPHLQAYLAANPNARLQARTGGP